MVAAVVAIAVLALMSLTLIDTGRGVTAGVLADAERARLAAAADAGLVFAVANLAATDRAGRWSIDGRARTLRFAGTDLTVRVEDERGKIPINQLTEEQVQALFETLGGDSTTVRTRTDSLLDWIDDDDEARQDGAEAPFYTSRGIRPRNGPLHSLDEMLLVRSIDGATIDRLRRVVTTYGNERDGFDERFAAPLALAIMSGSGRDSPAVIDRERELAGQRPAIELAAAESLTGRPLTVRVVAQRPGGGRFTRGYLIQLTGRADRPYVVRSVD